MKLTKIGTGLIEYSKDCILDLTVIQGMSHGHKNGSVISKSTERDRILAGEQFLTWANKKGLNQQDITPETINQFLDSHNWKPNTKNIKREHIIAIIKAQSTDIRFRFNVTQQAKKITKVKVSQSITRDQYLTRSEIDTLKASTKKGKTGLLIEFLFQTGCRADEMINIKLTDITLNGQAKIKIVGKGKKERVVYCKRELIGEIMKVYDSYEYLFCTTARGQSGKKVKYNRVNIFRILQLAGKQAGFRIHPHTFRHSCAMRLKETGKSAQYIQKYLGHSDPATTLKYYFHDNPGEEVTDCF